MRFGSLFAGIGGFDLGLERAGMTCAWQVENDPYACRVLAKHWPNVPRYGDIREVDWSEVERVDLICGGFPCQDISLAGKGAGIDGARSGLWSEYVRAVRALRPQFVLVENVPALLGRGMGRVLGDLAACGYDAEWSSVSACSMGAPHMRSRVFIVAHPHGQGLQERPMLSGVQGPKGCHDEGQDVAMGAWWASEPSVGRVADGVPSRVDRLRGLGNAVVPQVAEFLGRAILASELGA